MGSNPIARSVQAHGASRGLFVRTVFGGEKAT